MKAGMFEVIPLFKNDPASIMITLKEVNNLISGKTGNFVLSIA
ncbi:hypothetical protein [Oceanobacillus neutriphilus]|nr:hypothetical protein [Oceanobacillus neutriphilus]